MGKITKENIKGFLKEHWKELLVGTAVVVGGAMLAKKSFDGKNTKPLSNDIINIFPFTSSDIDIPEWEVGKVTDLWKENGYTNAIIGDVAVSDCGKLGEELTKIPHIKPDEKLSMIISTSRKT